MTLVDRSGPGVRITLLDNERAPSGEPLDLAGRIIAFTYEDAEKKADQVSLQLDRPPVPDGTVKAECPKFMSHGPCGGVRKGGFCEVYPEMKCPWVALYFKLEESGQVEWMTQL